jgi:flavin-dependent dehydrogenase
VGAIPYGYRRRAVIGKNVFPVGDQLCVIPSFTGDGTSLALSSGLAAAQAVLAAKSAGDFQTAFLERIRAQFLWARAVDATFKSAATRAFAVGAVAALPSLARLVASLTRVKGVPEMTVSGQS